MYLYKNVRVVLKNEIKELEVLTRGEKIVEIAEEIDCPSAEIIDGNGRFLSAGFIDLHVHGGGGFSAMGTKDDILNMARAHAKYGTTSILPTALAAPLSQLSEVCANTRLAMSENRNILGSHLEGPFLSVKMCGAQSTDNLFVPSKTNYTDFLDEYGDTVKMMGAAPELDGAFELGEELAKRGIVASVAHSSGNYDTAYESLNHGFSDITHIYNACTSCYKEGVFRRAGTVEAALSDDRFSVQAISDLVHLPVGVLRLIYKAKGADKMYLITDGLEFSAFDMNEGEEFTQKNGVKVVYEDEVMKLVDRSCLAGSTANGARLVRNMYKTVGVPLTEAVKMMTLTPARVIGVDSYKGKIAEGYDADIILFDESVEVSSVMINGKLA